MGGGQCSKKNYCTGPRKLATIPLYNPLKSPVGALSCVHKNTNGPLTDMALYIILILLMWANSLLVQMGGGLALEIKAFWAQ
jgi:hypothetical protein